jgi:sugar phosphate isomerase/epimerase
MILGLSSYTYGWAVGVRGHEPARPMDELVLLEQVRAHELKLLQIGDNLPLETFVPDRLKALRESARGTGIELEVGARGLTARRLELYAEIARSLDAKLIRFVIDDTASGYHPDLPGIITTIRDSVSSLDGLFLAIENHDRFSAADFRRIVDRVGQPNVGICLDTANSLGAGEGLETVIAALAPVTFNLHIKDFQVKRLPHMMGFTVTGCPAGAGLIFLPRLLDELRRFSLCRSAVLEQWTVPDKTIDRTIVKERDWAAASLKYLKPFFA